MVLSGLLHAPAALNQRKQPRLGGPKKLTVCYGKEKDILPLQENKSRFLDCAPHSLVNIPMSYSRSIYLAFECVRSLSSLWADYLITWLINVLVH
jgi:hypothetical protein